MELEAKDSGKMKHMIYLKRASKFEKATCLKVKSEHKTG